MYIGEGNITRLEHGHDSGLEPNVLCTLLARLSPDLSLVDFVTPPVACTPMCSDQVAQMRLLRELPMLYDINIATRQRDDESRGSKSLVRV
jgi:hypothetical protein